MRPAPRPWIVLAALAGAAAGCVRRGPPAPERSTFPRLTDIAAGTGIGFRHDNGFDGKRYRVVETVCGGLALLDYDGDGWLDIYLTNGRRIDPGVTPPKDALYRNNGDGTFTDVTMKAGLGDELMTLGCSVADVDGNGSPDIHVTNDGEDRLYRNNGDGTFTDIAPAAGLDGRSIDSGSTFLDMDEDGDLDLYVASYVIDETDHQPCVVRGVPGYCPPRNYPAPPHKLFENRDGRFVDVSKASGILDVEGGRGLGVISADFNDDGHADIYVANDTTANFMFLGDGRGRFTETGLANGTALGDQGEELGSMGLDAADYDGDGRLDLCVTNYEDEINNLYRAVSGDAYEDMARHAGVAEGSLPDVSWGVGLVDLDGDGWRDLFIANGHLNPYTRSMDESTSYTQPKRIFRNTGKGTFVSALPECGPDVRVHRVSRGAAFGDIDNDGDVDIVVLESGGKPEVLRNEGGNRASWCFILLEGAARNRDAIGARVRVTAGGRAQLAERRSSGSYLSANDPRLHFGLGSAGRIDRIEIRWPGGKTETHDRLPVRKLIRVSEGGQWEAVDLAPPTSSGK